LLWNWWKGKPSGSIACTRKQQPRFYWSCSSVVMNDATPHTNTHTKIAPLLHFIFNTQIKLINMQLNQVSWANVILTNTLNVIFSWSEHKNQVLSFLLATCFKCIRMVVHIYNLPRASNVFEWSYTFTTFHVLQMYSNGRTHLQLATCFKCIRMVVHIYCMTNLQLCESNPG